MCLFQLAPAESISEEGDVDAEFTNWRKLCIEEFELEPENIEKLINRDIAGVTFSLFFCVFVMLW